MSRWYVELILLERDQAATASMGDLGGGASHKVTDQEISHLRPRIDGSGAGQWKEMSTFRRAGAEGLRTWEYMNVYIYIY